MEEDYVMIPGSGTKKIIRDVKKEIETAFLDYSICSSVSYTSSFAYWALVSIKRRRGST